MSTFDFIEFFTIICYNTIKNLDVSILVKGDKNVEIYYALDKTSRRVWK